MELLLLGLVELLAIIFTSVNVSSGPRVTKNTYLYWQATRNPGKSCLVQSAAFLTAEGMCTIAASLSRCQSIYPPGHQSKKTHHYTEWRQ